MWQCGVQWEALIKGKGLSRAGNWTDSAICWTATALHPSLFSPSPPHFWSVTLIITYQHKHLPNYLRPGGVFCVSHPCRHLPGFSGCGGDDMKRARRLCVCVCAARPLDVRLHLQFVAHLQCSDMWGPKQIMPPLTFSCSCLTSSFGSRSHESCRHRTQCPLLSLLRDTSRLLWQGFVSHGRKGPKDNNGHSVT